MHSSVPFAPLYGIKGANFDPRQMNWIGSINAATGICVSWTASGITKWQDLFDKEFIVGGTGAGSQMETMPAMINKLFGTKIKIISGYKGGNDVYLAMERGEVHGRCGGLKSSIKSTRPDWFPQKKVSVPIQIALERDPEFADVPALVEFAKDEKTKQILELILAPMGMDRPILAPPGTPPDEVAALRKAFHEAMNDPGLRRRRAEGQHRARGGRGREGRHHSQPRLCDAARHHQGGERGDEPDGVGRGVGMRWSAALANVRAASRKPDPASAPRHAEPQT